MIEPLAGALIDDQYEIIRRLGEGGMGTVYLACQTELRRTVAVKTLHRGLLTDEEHRARFEREGKILSSLSHPNIVKFYRFGLCENLLPSIAMEYLDGTTLKDFLASGFPGLDRCLHIVYQMIDGLHFAHERQIVHRDIKPANIFIRTHMLQGTEETEVKLVDFGLARVIDDSRRQHLTRTGELIGSAFYMSPEQCLGKQADRRSDIYSCGCVIYEMFAGVPPFLADNPIGLMHLHANASIPSISKSPISKQLDKNIVQGLDLIFSKSMAKNPNDRYQDMLALKADLQLLQQGLLIIPPSKIKSVPPSARLTAAVLILSVFGALATVAYRHKSVSHINQTKQKIDQQSASRPISFLARLKSMTRMPPGKARLAGAEILLGSTYYDAALDLLNSVKDVDTATGGDLTLVQDYHLDRARALVWSGNEKDGAKEIESLLRAPRIESKPGDGKLVNLAAACWRAALPAYVDRIMDQYDENNVKNKSRPPAEILFDYTLLLMNVPLPSRSEPKKDKTLTVVSLYSPVIDAYEQAGRYAERVYQKLGKQAEAKRCREDFCRTMEQMRGKKYLELHSSFLNPL